MTWLGIGNVEGRLFRVVLATDGVRPDFTDRVIATDTPQRIADRLLASCRTGTDDALVVAVRFQGGGIAA